jgi:hypothetical protein
VLKRYFAGQGTQDQQADMRIDDGREAAFQGHCV